MAYLNCQTTTDRTTRASWKHNKFVSHAKSITDNDRPDNNLIIVYEVDRAAIILVSLGVTGCFDLRKTNR